MTTIEKNDLYNSKQFLLGVDVGGTSIKAKLYEVGKVAGSSQITGEGIDVFTQQELAEKINKTRLGFSNHLAQMTDVFTRAAQAAEAQDGKVVAIGIGMPGRFRDGQILQNTATQLDAAGNDFYEKDIKQAYMNALPPYLKNQNITFAVNNDGDMMLNGAVKALEKKEATALDQDGNAIINEEQFAAKTIGLLGLGTGVGNAFLVRDPNGSSKFVTDGHASKLLITVDEQDEEMLAKAEKIMLIKEQEQAKREGREAKPVVYRSDDGRVRSEDLFKDGTFCAIAEIENAGTFDPKNPEHQKAAAFAGKYMARTIEVVASGVNDDLNPEQGWDADAKKAAAKADAYIISGGLGQGYVNEDGTKNEKKSAPGKAIIDAAVKELKARSEQLKDEGNGELSQKLGGIQLAQFTGSPVAEKSAAETALQAFSRGVGR